MKYIIMIMLVSLTGCGAQGYYTLVPVKGEKGDVGERGPIGSSCTALQVAVGDPVLPNGGAVVTCGTNVALVANGEAGAQGVAGVAGQDAPVNPYSVTEVINPCGPQSSYDEVLLALGDGSLVALFTANIHGDYSRLSLIPDGNFVTTDNTSCNFNVATTGNTRTISWTGGSKSWTF